MPTPPEKGGGPQQRTTRRASRGGQKAVTGSGLSPEVAETLDDTAGGPEITSSDYRSGEAGPAGPHDLGDTAGEPE